MRCHINVQELRDLFLGLKAFLPYQQGKHVFIYRDNTTAMCCINKQGGPRSLRVCRPAVDIFDSTLNQGMFLQIVHLAGVDDVVANTLSQLIMRLTNGS